MYPCVSAILFEVVRSGKTMKYQIPIVPADAVKKLPIKPLGIKYSKPKGFSDRATGLPDRPVVRIFYTAGIMP